MVTVIIPTKGRATLKRTLDSIPDTIPVIVVADGPQQNAQKMVAGRSNVLYLETPATNFYGNTQRDVGIEHAKSQRLLFMDDDDWFVPGAFDIIAEYQHLDKPLIFQMRYSSEHPFAGRVLWEAPELRISNVGGVMFSPLNTRLAKWADGVGYISDYQFIEATLELQGPPIWVPEVICEIGFTSN